MASLGSTEWELGWGFNMISMVSRIQARLALLACRFLAVFVLAGLALPGTAVAQSVYGAQVQLDYFFPTPTDVFCTGTTVTAGDGVEFGTNCTGVNVFEVDVTPTAVVITFTQGVTWTLDVTHNGPRLTFTGATSMSGSNVAAGSAPVVGFVATANSLQIDWRGLSYAPGDVVTINLSGTFVPPVPTVTALSPTSGTAGGGTSVTLTGTNFTGATAVNFGGTPASAFTVNSATSITATAPAGTGTVDVIVTNAGGTSDAAGAGNDYTYTGVTGITPTSLPDGAVASAYSATLSATDCVGPCTFAVTAGALPAGVTLSSAGVISGTPTAGGRFKFTVTATDAGAGGLTASEAFSLTVGAPTIAVTPTTVPAATRGFAYSQAFAASGGTGTYTYALVSGSLPAGITLSPAGVLSGTPTVIGSFPIQIEATDQSTGSGPYSGTASVTLVVSSAAITVTPTSLPSVMAGVNFDRSLSATGGVGAYTYAVTSGALPSGITLSTAGRISGASYQVGEASFTVTATDSFGNTGSVPLRLTILARPDPSQDPDVRGLDAAQAEATRRLVSTQIDNFSHRLEQLRDGGGDQPVTMGLNLNSGVTDLGQQADQRTRFGGGRVFGQTQLDPERAELNAMLWPSMGAGGQYPDVAMGARSPVGFGSAVGLGQGGTPSPLNAATDQSGPSSAGSASPAGGARFWTGGAITIGERDGDTNQAKFSVRSTGISMGIDFAVSPNFDLGIGAGLGQESADVGQADSSVDSTSYVGVLYGSYRPQGGLYIDGMLGYGTLSFDLQRRVAIDNSLVMGERDGTAVFGSIGLGYDQPVPSGRLSTYGRLESMNAELDAYTETGSPLWALSYSERDVESLQGVFGGRFVWSHEARDSIWTPSFRIELRREFSDGGVQSLQYADWLAGPTYQVLSTGWDRTELNLGAGLNVRTASGWNVSGELGGRLSINQTSGTLRLALSRKF